MIPRYQSPPSHQGREWRLCRGGGCWIQHCVVGQERHPCWISQGGTHIGAVDEGAGRGLSREAESYYSFKDFREYSKADDIPERGG